MKHDMKDLNFEQSFDINDVSFDTVSTEFENKFRKRYRNALEMMSDSKDELKNAAGASTLGVLEQMVRQIGSYDRSSDFKESYENLMKEYEPFTET